MQAFAKIGSMSLGPKCAQILGFTAMAKKIARKPMKTRAVAANDAQMDMFADYFQDGKT